MKHMSLGQMQKTVDKLYKLLMSDEFYHKGLFREDFDIVVRDEHSNQNLSEEEIRYVSDASGMSVVLQNTIYLYRKPIQSIVESILKNDKYIQIINDMKISSSVYDMEKSYCISICIHEMYHMNQHVALRFEKRTSRSIRYAEAPVIRNTFRCLVENYDLLRRYFNIFPYEFLGHFYSHFKTLRELYPKRLNLYNESFYRMKDNEPIRSATIQSLMDIYDMQCEFLKFKTISCEALTTYWLVDLYTEKAIYYADQCYKGNLPICTDILYDIGEGTLPEDVDIKAIWEGYPSHTILINTLRKIVRCSPSVIITYINKDGEESTYTLKEDWKYVQWDIKKGK